MSYVSEKIRYEFESVPIELKSHILEKNIELHSRADLIDALYDVVSELDTPGSHNIINLAHTTLDKLEKQPPNDDGPAKVTF